MSATRILIALSALCVLATPAAALDRIIIPHDVHLENEVECAVCHEGVAEATDAFGSFLPDMDVCADCHDVDDDDNCATCHTDVDTAGEWTRPLRVARLFAHAPHVDRGMACVDCHGDLASAPPALPAMARCRECHDTADDFADCNVCHAADETLVPGDHRAGWDHRHGLAARMDQDRCEECHGPSSCLDCHVGDDVRPRVHELGFSWNHGLAARSHEDECATCHQEPQFCVACHRIERVLPDNHSRSDWLLPGDGGAHAVEGLFDLESCVACHDAGAAEPACARCHGG